MRSMLRKYNKDFWMNALLFSPGFLFYLAFMLLPIAITLYFGFFNWDGISRSYDFVGLSNYAEALQDKQFHQSTKVTVFITVVSTVLINVLGILFAVLLNKKGRITNFYRSVFFFPLLLSPVVVGFLWKAILNYNGIVNSLLADLGMGKIEFLGNPRLALYTITAIGIWQSLGFVIVLYLAGLQNIPGELYEAAKIDGASRWQEFRNVTFPLLAPAMTMCVVFIFTFTMREYDRVAVLTYGGPAGSTETLAYTIVRLGFSANRFSYASSMAILMMIMVGVVSVLLTVILRKREERAL